MATSRPMDARLKEKSSSASSAPHHTDTLHGRRATRPLVPASSSDRDPVRKPTASSSTTAISRGKSQTPSSAAAGKRVPVKSPIEKHPSPSGASRRVPTTNTLKERTGKSSSSVPRAAISSKPASDKASKPLKSAKGQPLVRTRSLGATTKKPTVTAIPDTIEPPPATKSEQEEETQIRVEESEPVDVPAIKDDVADDLGISTDSFAPNTPEDTTDSTSQTDQQEPGSPKNESEIATNDEGIGGDGNGEDGDKEKPKEPEEEPVIESSEEPQSEPAIVSGKPEEAETEKATAMESSETKKPEVVAFKRPEAAATGRKFIKDGPRSNDVIEEARTKLMVKRKSKVLALVGAFETVISLQEPEGQTGETSQSQGKSGEEGAEEESNATKESTEST